MLTSGSRYGKSFRATNGGYATAIQIYIILGREASGSEEGRGGIFAGGYAKSDTNPTGEAEEVGGREVQPRQGYCEDELRDV